MDIILQYLLKKKKLVSQFTSEAAYSDEILLNFVIMIIIFHLQWSLNHENICGNYNQQQPFHFYMLFHVL